jgi:hypothetical protein
MGEFRGEGQRGRGRGAKRRQVSRREDKKGNITKADLPTQKKLENRKENVDTRG